MENDILKYQIIKARLEVEKEIISENMMGIDFHALDPMFNCRLLTQETEKILGFGGYNKS
jgi:hypothetical protein